MDLPGLLRDWLGLTQPEEQRAAITGIFQMVGLFVTGMVALVSLIATLGAARRREADARERERARDERLQTAERKREDDRRAERVRDLQQALLAEIWIIVSHFESTDLEEQLKGGVEAIRQGSSSSPPFTPFIPQQFNPLVWPSIAEDIPVLPEAVIRKVVLVYDRIEALRLFTTDLRETNSLRSTCTARNECSPLMWECSRSCLTLRPTPSTRCARPSTMASSIGRASQSRDLASRAPKSAPALEGAVSSYLQFKALAPETQS